MRGGIYDKENGREYQWPSQIMDHKSYDSETLSRALGDLLNILSKMKEAADHIESQNKLIAEMREAYEHYELALATREHGVVAMGRMVAAIASIYSKSNPNTPERNEE